MRRISLALALVGAAAVTGCMSGTKSPAGSSDSGAQKGVAGSYYFVNLFQPPLGGIVTSDIGGISCGASAQAVSGTSYTYTYYSGASACGNNGQTQFAWGDTVVLTATPQGGNAFIAWAGDCSGGPGANGNGTCTLKAGADKTVVAIFGPPGSGHGNFMDPAVHGAAFRSGALDCKKCHGATLTGQGNAPACSSCHTDWQPLPNPAITQEACSSCHGSGPFSVASLHARTGKVVATATPAVVDGADLKFTVNVQVDGANKDGLAVYRAYLHRYNAALEAATVVAAFERMQLIPMPTSAPIPAFTTTATALGSGNYEIRLLGQSGMTGDVTFLVNLRDNSLPASNEIWASAVSTLNAPARDLVGDAACVNCHAEQVFRHREDNGEWHHGANPYGVQACTVCHTRSTSISRGMGGDRLTAYVHGIHNSHHMPERAITVASINRDNNNATIAAVTGPFTVIKPDGVYARNDSVQFSGPGPYTAASPAQVSSAFSVGFPGYMVNCATCHDTPARLAAIDAKPVTFSTCMSCHDGWDGFKDTQVGGAYEFHRPYTATQLCSGCHSLASLPQKYKASQFHNGLKTLRAGLIYDGEDQSIEYGKKFTWQITGVTKNDTTLLVTWTATYDGASVNPCNTTVSDTAPLFHAATANATTGQVAGGMSILKAVAQGDDWVNAGQPGTSVSPGQPTSVNLSATNTTCDANNVATSQIAADTYPTTATKGIVVIQGKPQVRFAAAAGTTNEVIQARVKSPTREFMLADGALPAANRRAIVDTAKCLDCHLGSLYQHGGNRVDNVDLCVTCHNPAASETNVRVAFGVTAAEAYDGKVGETYDMRTLVHSIHSAGETGKAYVVYRTRGIYLFGSAAAIAEVKANKNWPTTGGITCTGAEGPVTYYKVYGSRASGTVPAANPDGTCKTTGLLASTDGTWQVHNEIVVHYPRALNDCKACHTDTWNANDFGSQAQRMAVTMDAGASPWGNQGDDVLRGAGAQSCTTCHQFGPTLSWGDGPAMQAATQAHVNQYGWTPKAFPAPEFPEPGRATLINFATCGFVTCN